MEKRKVQASVKDEKLVNKRRNEMIKGAVILFKQKGFHRTTTREIARESGFSIGTLYEYIRTKEDILYLVCDSIYDEVRDLLQEALVITEGTLAALKRGIAYYFRIMDEMQDEVLVMYQEAKSLSKDALPYVLNKERDMAAMFERVIETCVASGEIELSEQEVYLLANNIIVQGQMWAFRRWALRHHFSIEQYIDFQTELLLTGIRVRAKGEQYGRANDL